MTEIDTTKPDRYFLKFESTEVWQEVTKEEWVRAERSAGFRNTMGQPKEPATSSFSNGTVSGTLHYRGEHLPSNFTPLTRRHEEADMAKMMTPSEFHADLVKKFNQHCEDVRKGKVEGYTFLADEGLDYNGWIEHRHDWPVTGEYLCGPALAADGEMPFEECDTCMVLVELYRDYCSRYRIEQARDRRERADMEG